MGQPHSTQERLILRARAGDRHAQQELWRTHRRWVAAIVLAHRPHAMEVDDLMQDVAVKLVSKLDSLREPGLFRPWLRQIVINVCRGHARSLRPTLHFAEPANDGEPHVANGYVPAAATDETAQANVDRDDAAKRLMRQVQSLPSEYREPLLLRCVRSLSYQQISDILELPLTTIETRLARARKMLRDELGDLLER